GNGNGKINIVNKEQMYGEDTEIGKELPLGCPNGSIWKQFKVVATRAELLVSSSANKLFYDQKNKLFDPNALILLAMPAPEWNIQLQNVKDRYQQKADAGKLELLVLRANANDCIELTLFNLL